MKRFLYLVLTTSLLVSCDFGCSVEKSKISLFLWSGLKWTWIDSGREEVAQKNQIYEELFGEGNSLRLHQSMCIFADRVFCINHGDECRVYDLQTKKAISSDILPDYSHHNNVQFSNIYLEDDDKYPLLFLSHGDYPPNFNNDLFLLSVEEDETGIYYSVFKTIHCSIQEAHNNGCWVVDDEHGILFLYCMTTGDYRVKDNNVVCIYSFSLPDVINQDDLSLDYDDVLEKWEYTYWIIQGGTYFNGYLLFNVQSLASLNGKSILPNKSVIAINTSNGHIEALLPLDDSKETEGICVYDNKLYVSFKEGKEKQSPTNVVFTLNQYTLPSSIAKDN